MGVEPSRSKPLRLVILDCCCPNPPELAAWPAVGDILAQWLAPEMPGAAFRRIDVWGGETLPSTGDADAFVVSGSEMGVYDDTPWMQPLRSFLLELREARRPVLGVCFGHQIMADTYGGKAELASAGYAAGIARFDWNGRPFDAYVLHGDQVTATPPGAVVTCSAPHCPVGGLAYDFPALSVQFHPEYERDYVDRVTDMLEGDRLDAAGAETARRSTREARVAPGLFAAEAAAFLRSGMSGAQFVASLRDPAFAA